MMSGSACARVRQFGFCQRLHAENLADALVTLARASRDVPRTLLADATAAMRLQWRR